jgi:uncharacterized protein YjiS (DUF1127 family)
MTALHDDLHHGFNFKRFFPRIVIIARCFAYEWWNRRQMANSVAVLSSRELQDIGLTSNDVQMLERLSLTEDSSQSLNDARNRQSGNW